MKILLVGSGGREHAIAWKLAQNKNVSKIFVAPGNGGTALENKCENINITDLNELVEFAKENNIDLNSMSLNELLEFIKKNPTVLKRPIMVDDKKIQVGYNPEEIRVFIPRARRIAQSMCSHENCPTFDTCPHLKDMEENNK